MKVWLFLVLLSAPLAVKAAEAPAAPVLNVPQDVSGSAAVVKPLLSVAPTPPPAPAVPKQESNEPPASVKVTAKDPKEALKAAFWPGVLLHGWGHHVAGDQDVFLNLAGGELFSVVMLGFGLAEALGPDIKDENKNTSQSIAVAGAVVFGFTWAWDLFGAKAAARRYNASLSLSLAPLDDGAQLALIQRF